MTNINYLVSGVSYYVEGHEAWNVEELLDNGYGTVYSLEDLYISLLQLKKYLSDDYYEARVQYENGEYERSEEGLRLRLVDVGITLEFI
jgi:hypothetical protein